MLCLFRIDEVTRLEHFTRIANHLFDIDRVVLTVVRTVVIDGANIRLLVGYFFQPWASCQRIAGDRAYPDLAIANILEYVRTMVFPPVDLVACR